MVHGRVVRPPHYGARLDALDEAPIRAMPGVIAGSQIPCAPAAFGAAPEGRFCGDGTAMVCGAEPDENAVIATDGTVCHRDLRRPQGSRNRPGGPYRFVDFAPGDFVKGERNAAYHVSNRPCFDTIEVKGGGGALASAILASLIKKPIVPPLAELAGLPSMGLATMKRPPLCE
jgi:hypothetical protein